MVFDGHGCVVEHGTVKELCYQELDGPTEHSCSKRDDANTLLSVGMIGGAAAATDDDRLVFEFDCNADRQYVVVSLNPGAEYLLLLLAKRARAVLLDVAYCKGCGCVHLLPF